MSGHSAPDWQPDRPSLDDWGVSEDEARALLRRQMCPACGKGPWKSPLTHAAKAHGIDRFTMRDVCGLTTTESLIEAELRERRAALGREQGRDMRELATQPRRKYRQTKAGRRILAANLAAYAESDDGVEQRAKAAAASKTPEARAKQGAALRARWDGLTDEQRAEQLAHLAPWQTPAHLDHMRRVRWGEKG